MAEVTNFTDPISGSEVVADVLAQIKKRLATDCNLRATDGYSGGYSGTITVSLKLHAVRISEVEMTIPITAPALPSPDAFPLEEIEPVEIDEVIEIPIEPNLREVRERTVENNSEPTEETALAVEGEEPETGTRQKRKYTRRALAGVGAVEAE